jgi:hypothetical protein
VTSPERAGALALALPETVEQDHHGRPSFRVTGKIFATLWDEQHMNPTVTLPGTRRSVWLASAKAKRAPADSHARVGETGLFQALG